MNLSRHQLLQFISENAFGSGGRRCFLLSSDTDGRTWVAVAESMRPFPRHQHRRRPGSRGHWKERVSDPSSLDPVFGSVVSISSADDGDVCTFDADIADDPVDNSDYPIEPVAIHLSESSGRVSAAVSITSAIPEVTKDRSLLQVDTPALVSEADCFPPTLPGCKSEPSDDEFLDPESSFSSVHQQRDPGLVHARPHPVSVDPVPGLLPGFCFLFTETDDSGHPVVDSPVGLSPQLDSLDIAQKVSLTAVDSLESVFTDTSVFPMAPSTQHFLPGRDLLWPIPTLARA